MEWRGTVGAGTSIVGLPPTVITVAGSSCGCWGGDTCVGTLAGDIRLVHAVVALIALACWLVFSQAHQDRAGNFLLFLTGVACFVGSADHLMCIPGTSVVQPAP